MAMINTSAGMPAIPGFRPRMRLFLIGSSDIHCGDLVEIDEGKFRYIKLLFQKLDR